MKSTRRYLEFDEDIAGIIEDVEMPMQALKDKTPLTEKATGIAKEKIFRGDKITRYMRKSPVEGSACKTTRKKPGQEPAEGHEGRSGQHLGARYTGGNVGQRQRSGGTKGMSQEEGHGEQSNGRDRRQRRGQYRH